MLNNSGELSENSGLEPDYPTLENYDREYFSIRGTTLEKYYGYQYETEIDTVKIPYGVTTIGESAFRICRNIKNVIIPNSVTSIERHAFEDCTRLESITIPKSVTLIQDYSFSNCTNLKKVNITDIAAWCNIEFGFSDSSFADSNPLNHAHNLYLNNTPVVVITADMLEGATEIKHFAFIGCISLTSITIPDSVTSIGSGAFLNCSELSTVIIPNSVTSIGSGPFAGCCHPDISSLYSDYGPKYFVSLKIYCYAESKPKLWYASWDFVCKNINQDVHAHVYWGYKDEFGFEIVGSEILRYKGTEKEVKIPEGITSIGEMAFNCCKSLESVTIPDSVTSIGQYAFYNCTNLTNITIPANVASIGKKAFCRCTRLTVYCNVTKKPDGWDKNWNIYKGNNIFNRKRLHVVWEIKTDIIG